MLELQQFTGTTAYHKWSILFRNHVLTDGAKYLAEEANCFWLMDAIASHITNPKVKAEYFQVWKLVNTSKDWQLTCEDGNYNIVASQTIVYSDFPLDSITLWCIQSGDLFVIMLPSEY